MASAVAIVGATAKTSSRVESANDDYSLVAGDEVLLAPIAGRAVLSQPLPTPTLDNAVWWTTPASQRLGSSAVISEHKLYLDLTGMQAPSINMVIGTAGLPASLGQLTTLGTVLGGYMEFLVKLAGAETAIGLYANDAILNQGDNTAGTQLCAGGAGSNPGVRVMFTGLPPAGSFLHVTTLGEYSSVYTAGKVLVVFFCRHD
jgi:hypothetical protein